MAVVKHSRKTRMQRGGAAPPKNPKKPKTTIGRLSLFKSDLGHGLQKKGEAVKKFSKDVGRGTLKGLKTVGRVSKGVALGSVAAAVGAVALPTAAAYSIGKTAASLGTVGALSAAYKVPTGAIKTLGYGAQKLGQSAVGAYQALKLAHASRKLAAAKAIAKNGTNTNTVKKLTNSVARRKTRVNMTLKKIQNTTKLKQSLSNTFGISSAKNALKAANQSIGQDARVYGKALTKFGLENAGKSIQSLVQKEGNKKGIFASLSPLASVGQDISKKLNFVKKSFSRAGDGYSKAKTLAFGKPTKLVALRNKIKEQYSTENQTKDKKTLQQLEEKTEKTGQDLLNIKKLTKKQANYTSSLAPVNSKLKKQEDELKSKLKKQGVNNVNKFVKGTRESLKSIVKPNTNQMYTTQEINAMDSKQIVNAAKINAVEQYGKTSGDIQYKYSIEYRKYRDAFNLLNLQELTKQAQAGTTAATPAATAKETVVSGSDGMRFRVPLAAQNAEPNQQQPNQAPPLPPRRSAPPPPPSVNPVYSTPTPQASTQATPPTPATQPPPRAATPLPPLPPRAKTETSAPAPAPAAATAEQAVTATQK